MSLSTWITTLRVHWLSRPRHWADVMAQADALQSEHDGQAETVARQRRDRASGRRRRLLGDVAAELRRRAPD